MTVYDQAFCPPKMTTKKGFISLAPWWRKKQVDILATEETLELGGKSTFSKNLNSFLKKKNLFKKTIQRNTRECFISVLEQLLQQSIQETNKNISCMKSVKKGKKANEILNRLLTTISIYYRISSFYFFWNVPATKIIFVSEQKIAVM